MSKNNENEHDNVRKKSIYKELTETFINSKIDGVQRIYNIIEDSIARKDLICRNVILQTSESGVGCISITGDGIFVRDVDTFTAISIFADNIDIYPKTNGLVEIDFTFHGFKTIRQ